MSQVTSSSVRCPYALQSPFHLMKLSKQSVKFPAHAQINNKTVPRQSVRETDGRTHGQGNYTDSGYDFQQLCKPCSLSTLWVLVHLEHKGGWGGGGRDTYSQMGHIHDPL